MEKLQTIMRKSVLLVSIPLIFDLLKLLSCCVNEVYRIFEVAIFLEHRWNNHAVQTDYKVITRRWHNIWKWDWIVPIVNLKTQQTASLLNIECNKILVVIVTVPFR